MLSMNNNDPEKRGTLSGDRENLSGERKGRSARWIPSELPIFLIYLAVTLFLTWPLIVRFSTSIYGVPADNMAGIWFGWWCKNAGSFGGSASFCPLIGFPFGTRLGLVSMEPLTYITDRILLFLTNEVIACNLQMLASFFLSGVTMYYLVRYLTRDRRAAFFGGLAYLIVPYHAFNSMYMGGGITCVQWMPLYILLLLKFIREPSGKNCALLALGAVLVAGTSAHYGLFMAVFTVAFLTGRYVSGRIALRRRFKNDPGVENIERRVNRKTLALSLLILFIVVVTITPFLYVSVKQLYPPGKWKTYPIPSTLRINKYTSWSAATPREYFDPLYGYHIIESKISEEPWTSGMNSHKALYIGWVLVVLAALGLIVTSRRTKREGLRPGESGKDADQPRPRSRALDLKSAVTVQNAWGFAASALVCFVMSLSTHIKIGSVTIPMPSILFRYVTPWYRWYLRIGIVVSICFMVLACFGLAWIMKRVKGFKRNLLLVILSVVLALETLIVPPFVNFNFNETPEVFEMVADLPEDAAIAFYPLLDGTFFTTSMLMFSQRWFRKPMLNGAVDNSDGEAVRRTVYNPFNKATPGILRRFDLDYMVYFEKWFEEHKKSGLPLALPPGLESVEEFDGEEALFGGGRLLEITAEKADLVPLYLGDITVPAMDKEGKTVRMMLGDGVIQILNFSGEDRPVTLKLPMGNSSTPRTVLITGDDKPLWRGDIETGTIIEAEIDGVIVPAEGLELRVLVEGEVARMSDSEIHLFGVEYVSLGLGDLEILPR